MKSCTIFTALWGEEYVARFLSLNIRTLLAPGNLPAFAAKIKARYLIMIPEEDRRGLEESPIFKSLRDVVEVELLELSHTARTHVDRKNMAWSMATEYVKNRGEYAIQMPPDVTWSDGSLDHLANLMLAGKKAIFVNWHVRARAETFIPAFEEMVGASAAVSVPGRQLVRMSMKHSHPLNSAYLRHTKCSADWPEMMFWPVQGQGLLMHVHALTPFVFDTGSCEINHMRLLGGRQELPDLEFVVNSDNVFMVSLADQDKDRDFYGRMEEYDIARIAWWWLQVHVPSTDQLAAAPFRLLFDHNDEAAWTRQEAAGRNYLRRASHTRELYRIWDVCRQQDGLQMASAVIAHAIGLGLAGAVVRKPEPVALFVPDDSALESHWSEGIDRILSGSKRSIVKLLRAHATGVGGLKAFEAAIEARQTGEAVVTADGTSRDVIAYSGPGIGRARILKGPISVGDHVLYVIDRLLYQLPPRT